MNYNALIIVLVFALLFFVWSIFKLFTMPKGGLKKASAAGGNISIEVRRESDGIHLVIPDVVSMEDDSESIFPDIINDVAPEDHGLGPEFWERVARMPENGDPAEREQLAQQLASAGLIAKEDIPAFALLGESASVPPEEKPLPAPDPSAPEEEEPEVPDTRQGIGEYPELEPYPEPQIEPLPSPDEMGLEVLPAPEPSSPGPSEHTGGDFANHDFNYK